jgi:hypothetical protein
VARGYSPALAAKLAAAGEVSEMALVPGQPKPLLLQRSIDGVFRKHGNSVKLSAAFFGDFTAAWDEFGVEALRYTAQHHPAKFVEIAARLSKVVRLEVGAPGEFERPRNRAELLAKMEERGGAKGRELLEKFLGQIDAIGRRDRWRYDAELNSSA